jgi:membrane associated rhomboid family serine protease
MDYLNSSRKTLLSDYEHNPLLRLVFFCGCGYVILQLVKIVIFMWQQVPSPESTAYFENKIYVHFALQPLAGMLQHPWTLVTFMFTGLGFFKLFTTLVWLFLFGNVVQQLVGRSEVFPLFLVANIVGGIAFVGLQLVYNLPHPSNMFSGADAAVFAFAFGALAIAPKYRVYLSSNFSVPLGVLVLIYVVLNVVSFWGSTNLPYFGLLVAGAVVGCVYLKLAKRGCRLGVWGNKLVGNSAQKIAGKKKIGDKTFEQTNDELDAILDKINESGIQSLNKEERELLQRYK